MSKTKKLFSHFLQFNENPNDIENYEDALKSNFKSYILHHRLETHTSDGEPRLVQLTPDELVALGMYYQRPASELIYLNRSEHMKVHSIGKSVGRLGHSKSNEFKQARSLEKKLWWEEHPDFKPVGSKGKKQSTVSNLKRSKSLNGRISPMKGQTPWNKDKHWPDEVRAKISKSLQGRTAWNKGRTTSSKLWDAYIKYFTNPILLCYINRSK